MENADTYDAPLPAGDGKATTWPEIIPPLADDEASKQLHDALSSVQPSKDPSVISAKPSSAAMDAYKRHFVHFLSVLKSTEKTDNSNNNNNTNNGNSNNSSNINSNNKEPAMALLVQTLDQLMPTLPPTPEVEDGDPQTLLQPDSAVAEEDLRHMLIAMAAAGYPRDMTEAAYNISNLASTENFGSLMTTAAELREKHPSPNGATSGLTTDALALLFQQKTDGLQPEQQQQQQQQSSMAYHQHRDLAAALAVQDDGQLPVSLQPQDYASLFASATFSPHDDTHLQCKSPAAAPFGQQNTVNHYISPASLDRSNPAGNGDLSLLSAIAPAALGHRRATSANSEQNGLPSPLTQASSNHSEAPQSPPSMLGLSGVPVVICPLHDPDGRSCGKRCSGAKPYRSIQEHIRRAHPDRYIAGLPANEESFQAMVNTEGVICPIPHSDGSPCGTRCTGSKPYRSIQDHIRDTHPEHFVPNLPANEASFRISESILLKKASLPSSLKLPPSRYLS
ncbi:hypothetical protein BD289DRAFT_39726 [Coniella lustricola]|uniref:Uncharacterized protein n=1 Tax=Coniella lustricola TaxID=2025994 RepID=A0A2T3AIU2_9PEZI|nr:hypothetical protein BD289DRAFT_39726 [Coniella lustricola]